MTSIDSGYLAPIDVEKLAGWESRHRIAYSPLVQEVATLPRGGWDEWYVFAQPVELGVLRLSDNIFDPRLRAGEVGLFVNYRFTLHLPEMRDLADMFWSQIDHIQPDAYIAANEWLTFVTRDARLFDVVAKALSYPSES